MNPYLKGGSSISSNKPLVVFTGTDHKYSEDDYLNAVTANIIFNIGPEPVNTPLHQNWTHRRTTVIQSTLDDAAQKWFSVVPLDIKSWKRFTREIIHAIKRLEKTGKDSHKIFQNCSTMLRKTTST